MTEAAQSGKIDMFPRKQKTIVCMVYSSMKNVLWKEIVRQMGFSLSFWWIYLCACTTFWRCCVLLDFSSVYGTFYKKVTTKVVPLRSSTKGFAPHPRKNIAIVFLQCYMYWVRLIDIQSPRTQGYPLNGTKFGIGWCSRCWDSLRIRVLEGTARTIFCFSLIKLE